MNLTKTPYLVLFILLGAVGVGAASAIGVITLAGDVNITGNADVDGDLNVDGTITGAETLEGLGCSTEQVARFDGNNWVCGQYSVKNNPVTTVFSEMNVGLWPSIAIGADNLPVISFHDITNGNLMVAHCNNTSCSSGATTTTVDSAGNVGRWTSIAIGSDNLPVISYYDFNNQNLKVAHCGDIDCAEGTNSNTITTVFTGSDVGQYNSITIGADNLPVISFYDALNGNLKVTYCNNTSCSSGATTTTVDVAGDVGRWTSIAIGSDNLPVISYHKSVPDFDLKVVHCGDIDCAEGTNSNTISTVDSAGNVGRWTSIAIGSDNLPVISYYDFNNQNLKVAHCNDINCFGGSLFTLDDHGNVGQHTSIAIDNGGTPVISYFDGDTRDLKVAHCQNIHCSTAITTTLDTVGFIGEDTSIAIGADNNPIISYRDFSKGNLKVVVEGAILIFE